jgi:signal transduction histidine kinase
MGLGTFITTHRELIVRNACAKGGGRAGAGALPCDLPTGMPLFLTQLADVLSGRAAALHHERALGLSAATHGRELLARGLSVRQVVHHYGDVCQAITELAAEKGAVIETREFQVLNRCLDDAIAEAVSEHVRQRDADVLGATTQRQGFLAHELRGHLGTAMLALQIMKSGDPGSLEVGGGTADILSRSLGGLRELIDRSVSEVRRRSGAHRREAVRVADLVAEMGVDASVEARQRGVSFRVECPAGSAAIDVDRFAFTSALSNVLRNAFKFSKALGHVVLRVRSAAGRVAFEVQDECGGLPPGATEMAFLPFEQLGSNHEGLGLGLAISREAVEADGGAISLRDLPGKGCVVVIDMPASVARAPADQSLN